MGGTPISCFQEQILGQIGGSKSELTESVDGSACVRWTNPDPDIEVVCSPHVPVDTDGIASDQQILNTRRV
jgi:hypothetical protein